MSQPAICNKCKDAGFPHEMIKFEKSGTKEDGSTKWKPVNVDGTEHKHKEKPGAASVQMNLSDQDGMKDLAAAVRELAAAIRSRRA
jgi:hypothetical protein